MKMLSYSWVETHSRNGLSGKQTKIELEEGNEQAKDMEKHQRGGTQ